MSHEDQIAAILADYNERLDRGEWIDPEAVLREHPDLSDELQERFAAMQIMEQLFSDEPAPQPDGERVLGDYRLLREIGRGGMGVVYEAEQMKMGRRVALKVLSVGFGSSQAVKRFQREAKAAGQLHHTNIVPVYELDSCEGQWFYAMELVQGRPLSDVLKEIRGQDGRPTEESLARAVESLSGGAPESAGTGTGSRAFFVRIAEMFAGVAEALELAHREDIVHRDIKPSNLLVAADGNLKIVDFGLARVAAEGPSMTITGDLLGTPAYMSPEQALAKRMHIDYRTDIYSLGATLYEVLTLRRPFDGQTLQEVCSQIITKDPLLPRRANQRVPRDLETICLKAMEKDRDKRYASARAFARDLRAFAEGGAIQARRISPVGRAWRKAKRHKVRSALAAAAVVCAAVAVWLAVAAAERHRQETEANYLALVERGYAVHLAGGVARLSLTPEYWLPKRDSPAADHFTAAIRLLPDRPEAYVGRALAADRTADERLADLERARGAGVSARTYHLARAYVLHTQGRTDDAELEHKLAAAAAAPSAMDRLVAGSLACERARYGDAETHLTAAIDATRPGAHVRKLAHRIRARVRARLDDLDGALVDMLAIRYAGDDSPGTRAALARLWRKLGREPKAEEEFAALLRDLEEQANEAAWLEAGSFLGVTWLDWQDRFVEAAARALPESARVARARALQYLLRDRLSDAIAEAERALELDRGSVEAKMQLATTLAWSGKRDEANRLIDEVRAVEPGEVEERARALVYADRFEEAVAEADRLVEMTAGRSLFTPHHLRGVALQEAGRHEEAIEAFDRALALNPAGSVTIASRALSLVRTGRGEEGLREFDRAVAMSKWSPVVREIQSLALGQLGRREEQLAAADSGLELAPESATLMRRRGAALYQLGRYEEALAMFREAAARQPWACHHRLLGQSLKRLGRPEEALRAFDQALAVAVPGDWEYRTSLRQKAWTLRSLGRLDEAQQLNRHLLAVDPKNMEAHTFRFQLLLDRGELARALDAADEAVKLLPERFEVHLNRGVVLFKLGRAKEALDALERARERGGDSNAVVHQNRAEMLHVLGRLDAATDAYARWIELEPGKAATHEKLARALYVLGRDDAATGAFRRAIELDPGLEVAHAGLARVLLARGKLAEALRAADHALALDATLGHAHWTRADVLRRRGQTDEAEAAYREAAKTVPMVAVALAGSLARTGRHADAERVLARAAERFPRDSRIQENHGRALSRVGRHEEALAAFDRALDVARTPEARARAVAMARESVRLRPKEGRGWRTLGRALLLAGEPQESIEALTHAVELDPGSPGTAWLLIAVAKHDLGHEDAREWYDKAVASVERHEADDPKWRQMRAWAEQRLATESR